MNSTETFLFCLAIPSLSCRTLRGRKKSYSLFARRLKTYARKLSPAKMTCVLFLFCAVTAIASPAQTFNTLVDFDGTDGANPQFVSLVQGTDGNYYGTTTIGGDYNVGTVFKTTPAGVLTTLYSFCSAGGCTDGISPYAGLVLGTDGN